MDICTLLAASFLHTLLAKFCAVCHICEITSATSIWPFGGLLLIPNHSIIGRKRVHSPQKSAGNGHALPLTTTQFQPPFSHQSIIPLWHSLYSAGQLCQFCNSIFHYWSFYNGMPILQVVISWGGNCPAAASTQPWQSFWVCGNPEKLCYRLMQE